MRTMRRCHLSAWLPLLLAACSHSSEPPTTVPIAAVTSDVVYVVNGGDATLSVIDATTYAPVGQIAIKNASYPHHIYLSPDRSRLLVAVPGVDLSGGHGGGGGHGGHAAMGAVLLLDAATGRTIAARTFDQSNHNAAFSPDGREVWTSQVATPGSVLVLDAGSLATLRTIAVGDMPAEVTFSRDGKYAFVANGASNDVTVVDTSSKAVVKRLPVGANPVGAWPGLDGKMYVDCETDKTIWVIDVQTLTATLRHQLGFTPGMAATPTTSELWVSDADGGRVVVYKTSDDTKLGEAATGAGAHAIAFSGDAKTAFVTNQGANTLTIVDVATRQAKKTVGVGSKPNGIVFRAK